MAAKASTPTFPVRREHVQVDGLRLHVAHRFVPQCEIPLLIFNGIGANLEVFQPFMEALGERSSLIFDMPGIGASQATRIPMRFSGLAALSAKLLEHFALPQVDVLGVSWGGALAQEFAYRQAARCRRLVLAATSPGVIMVPGRLSVLMKLTSPKRYLMADYLRSHAATIYGGRFRDDDALVDDVLKFMKPSASKWGYYSQLFAGAGWTSIHWLHRIYQPTLIIAGKDDPIVPLANAYLLQLRIPDARLQQVECGHLFLFTMMPEIVPSISDFLNAAIDH